MVPNVVTVNVMGSSAVPVALPDDEHPVATSAIAATVTAAAVVRRENFTVTPLCAWMVVVAD
jgi:hypothetical protein